MPHAIAMGSGAQRSDNHTELGFDVLVVSDSIDGGSTYVSVAAQVDVEGSTAEEIQQAITAAITTEVSSQLDVNLDPGDISLPQRTKGVAAPAAPAE